MNVTFLIPADGHGCCIAGLRILYNRLINNHVGFDVECFSIYLSDHYDITVISHMLVFEMF